jgi:hypothetical protein
MQRILKVPSPISHNIQHSDVFGTQDSTTIKVFKKEKKKKIIMRFKSWLVLSKILLTILQDIWPRELLEG